MTTYAALALADAEIYREANRNFRFLQENYERLVGEYPDHYVLIRKSEVLYADPRLERVLDFVRSKRFNESEIVIEFLPAEDSALVV